MGPVAEQRWLQAVRAGASPPPPTLRFSLDGEEFKLDERMCPDVAKLARANTLSPWPRATSSEIPPSQRWARVTATPRNWFSLSRRGRIRLRRRAIWSCMTSASGCTSCPARSRSGKLGREVVRAPHGPARQGPTARRCPCVRAGWGQATERRPAATAPGRKGPGQRVGRGRAPPPLDKGTGHPAALRRQLVCLASVGSCDCAPAHAAKARVRRHPHGARHKLRRGAGIAIARRLRPRAKRQQGPLRPQAPRRRLHRPRAKRGRHRPRPLSWPLRTGLPAPLARSTRHADTVR